MQTGTSWKCHRCDLMFKKEHTATTHHDIFKHPIQKIEISIFN